MKQTKKFLFVIAAVLCLFTLGFGTLSVQAASLKATAKKEIGAVVKKQHKQITKYAKTTGYKVTKKKKAESLKKDGKSYSQEWTISFKNKTTTAVIEAKFVNTYAKKAKKVSTKISANVLFEDKAIVEGKELKNVAALKKVLKSCSTKKGLRSFAKKNVDNSAYEANQLAFYCPRHRRYFLNFWNYLYHRLSVG